MLRSDYYFGWIFFVFSVFFIHLINSTYKRPNFCDQKSEPFSFLWRIKGGDPPSYLFGTIHVPYTKVWNYIPQKAKEAFASSSEVYFELDLVNPTTVSALSSCQMLPQGRNLSDVLPGDLYSRLKKHLEQVREMMPHWMTPPDQREKADYLFNAIAGEWERKRPVWVMLMVNSLTESDVRSRGVPVLDLYLTQEAERMKKKTAAVERVEEQCLPLNSLNFSQVVFALNHTLLQYEFHQNEPSYTTDDLIRHYNCGDLNASQDTAPLPALCRRNSSLSDEELSLAKNIDNYFRQELIYSRNKRMGGRVAHLIRHSPNQSLFFAFGAGHFLGNNTVLDFIQAQGFEIEHVTVSAKIPKSKSKKSLGSETPSSIQKNQGRRSNHHFLKRSQVFKRTPESTSAPTILPTLSPVSEWWLRLDSSAFSRKNSDASANLLEAFVEGRSPASIQMSSDHRWVTAVLLLFSLTGIT